MNKKLLLVPLLVFGFLAFFLYQNLGKNAEYIDSALIGQPLPQFSGAELLSGNTISSSELKGPALLNVWATWCPTCYAEHNMLLKLLDQGVQIYGINYRDDTQKAIEYLSTGGNPYAVVLADEQAHIGFELGVYGAPETFFIDSNNIIRYRHIGEISEQNWQGELKAIYDSL